MRVTPHPDNRREEVIEMATTKKKCQVCGKQHCPACEHTGPIVHTCGLKTLQDLLRF